MKRLMWLCPFVLLIASCASTSISTLRNPSISNMSYAKILVSVPFQDLELRRHAENQFVSDFKDAGINAVAALEVIPPVKQYSNDEIGQILAKNSIDAFMVVTLTDAYSDQSYVPGSSQTSSSATIYGNSVYGSSRTTTNPGYTISKPRARFEVNLYDVRTGEVAWRATTFTRGNGFANSNTVLDSLASEVVKKYEMDSSN